MGFDLFAQIIRAAIAQRLGIDAALLAGGE
jgi:hypothetical protein